MLDEEAAFDKIDIFHEVTSLNRNLLKIQISPQLI
jgi:hypothetical protein